MGIGNQPAADSLKRVIDARRQPRFRLAVGIKVNSKSCGIVKGHTVDISGSGISAMLTLEVPVGELVELQFTIPYGPVTVYATVRQRVAFRYGFQFVDSPAAQETIQSTCRSLEMEQSLKG